MVNEQPFITCGTQTPLSQIFDFLMKKVIIFMIFQKSARSAEIFGNPFKTSGNFMKVLIFFMKNIDYFYDFLEPENFDFF